MSVVSTREVNDALPSVAISRKQMVVASVVSLLGYSLDLFDLFVLLYVAPEVGKLFFPTSVPTLSLAAVYASFAVTLLMRPLGSAVFGSYADRKGRKKSMAIAVTGVGLSTALIGALPTLEQIGITAVILFILLRLVQGVFVGGVIACTHTISTESVPPKWRGFMSGFIGAGGAGLGALLASIVYYIVSMLFPGPSFSVWGWRFMFFAGILSSVVGFFVFKILDESPLWLQLKQAEAVNVVKPAKSPIRTLVSRQYLTVLLVNLMIVIGGGTAYYLTSGYLPTFLKVINKIPAGVSSVILIEASIVAIIASVLVGGLSEVLGRKKTFLVIGIVNIVALPFLYTSLARATTIGVITVYSLALAFLGNAAFAPMQVFLNERFPTSVRAVGTGLSWNVGFAIGGMMPTFVSLASRTTQDIPVSLAYFSVGVFVLYLIGSLIISETKGQFK